MKLRYDKSITVAGLGVFPWARLGPERWLQNYIIASAYGWDVAHVAGAPRVLVPGKTWTSRPTTQALVDDSTMLEQLVALKGYDYLPYKPVAVPEPLQQRKFLITDQSLAKRIENKATFRQLFEDDVRFPAFRILERASISRDTEGLEKILQGKSIVILQDEQLSGGKGTYKVHDLSSLNTALDALERLKSGTYVVVSEYIEQAYERSVQCCVTRYGVFVGPLQKQIVGHALLTNALPGSDQFCGGEIGGDDNFLAAYGQIRNFAMTIGNRLAGMGYKGIFGLDCLVNGQGDVFVLEVNPRLTGMTPLLTMLYRDERDIPFYLLHILELGTYDYTIEDRASGVPARGGMLVQHHQGAGRFSLTDTPASGVYLPDDVSLHHKAVRFDDTDDHQLLLQCYAPPKTILPIGTKLFYSFFQQINSGPI